LIKRTPGGRGEKRSLDSGRGKLPRGEVRGGPKNYGDRRRRHGGDSRTAAPGERGRNRRGTEKSAWKPFRIAKRTPGVSEQT